MKTPKNRKEFEKHLYILAESIERGTFHISSGFRTTKGLMNVKKSPNKRIDFKTVDESARLLANSITNMQQMERNNSRLKK
ncbi:AVAST type 1 anti-phage system protein Avs1c [Flavobacterium psychrophilum]|uniref:AVAST type 1 anti-phage system protein Avs1c n=1 Tax=Flavobacterium psychrophilum TaxID=96345 RepID=UPI000B7C1DA3|nr:AVAST type 1 anti-phage system protein Avs1c [Flavobacterium psychrophilum]EKT4500647.1 hypothetical protein [Flavobacterium psychrophilum]MBF2025060.1 hypothetical protein [Flavobacterium psychrophilum]MCB5984385.1 hypothetical protein [Flavobacterium psychrophilum]MCB5995051.1 hypothetical protein [Flavobacterium psychrophilum]MCB5997561.1 hypothetical protein [Flavobacterium psychrophilum]